MKKKDQSVRTMAQLERLMPEIIKKVNKDQELALRAASNPLLALEEMGYVLDRELYYITYRRLRHSKATSERMNELAEEIYQYAGKRFDIEDPSELEDVLFKQLDLKEPMRKAIRSPAGSNAKLVMDKKVLSSPEPAVLGKKDVEDRLECARDVHPVMRPLLEYRNIDAKVPKYATRETYERIRKGEIKLPITKIRLRITRKIATEV